MDWEQTAKALKQINKDTEPERRSHRPDPVALWETVADLKVRIYRDFDGLFEGWIDWIPARGVFKVKGRIGATFDAVEVQGFLSRLGLRKATVAYIKLKESLEEHIRNKTLNLNKRSQEFINRHIELGNFTALND